MIYIPSGDSAFIIRVGDGISEEINLTVRKLAASIESKAIKGVTDLVPSYNELLVCYNPLATGYRSMLDSLRSCEAGLDSITLPPSFEVTVPVVYGGEYGPDLKNVAELNSLSPKEVIDIHSSVSYLIYMLGFTPGFCYLGGMDNRIAAPRRKTPRLTIPAGAVGIAGNQTGIYPIASPGGWNLIGQTPLRLFDPQREPVFLFSAGDRIRFTPVTHDEFERIADQVAKGTFEPVRKKME